MWWIWCVSLWIGFGLLATVLYVGMLAMAARHDRELMGELDGECVTGDDETRLRRLQEIWFAGEHDLSGVRERFVSEIEAMKGKERRMR